jgi:hypothetical protein
VASHAATAEVRPIRLAIGRPVLLAGACVALAALSLLLPSAPSYDPLSWLIWGREIAHLDLTTTDGPSWKPLPVVFTTFFAPAGAAAPTLWLLVARAGALAGLVAAYRLAARLAGPVAGVIAAAGIVLSSGWLWSSWLGYSEGLLVALVLGAGDRVFAGRHRQALVLGFLAGLLRPELWPFLAVYCVWLWRRDPAARRLIAGLAALIPLLWFVPELLGSGNALRAAERARQPAPGSRVPAFAHHPGLALLENAGRMLMLPLALGILPALIRPGRRVALLAGWTAAWVLLVAAMTQVGYSGNERYLVAPAALACVVAGVGWARAFRGLLRVAGPVLLLVASLPWVVPRVEAMWAHGRGMGDEAVLVRNLSAAIANAGGRARVLACGQPVTAQYQVPLVAWALRVHIKDVGLVPGPGTVQIQPTSDGRWEIRPACG